MAIVRDTSINQTNSANGATSFTVAYTCTGSNLCLLVHIRDNNGDVVTGVTYNGVAMSQLVKQKASVAFGEFIYIYGLLAPATGANNIVVSRSGASNVSLQAISYTGVKQSGLPDATKPTTSAVGTTVTGTITTVADNAIVSAYGYTTSGTPTAGTGSTAVGTGGGACQLFESTTFPISPAGNYSMDSVGAVGENSIVQASLAPAITAASVIIIPQLLTLSVG